MERAELIAVAEVLGIDTSAYRAAVESCNPENIARTAAQISAAIDLEGLQASIAAAVESCSSEEGHT